MVPPGEGNEARGDHDRESDGDSHHVHARRSRAGDRMTTSPAPATPSPVTVPTLQDRARCLEPLGWSGREAKWIALVALHTGVFTRSQLSHFLDDPTRVAASRFVRTLIDKQLATEDERAIQCDKALPTYLVLIPIVYVRFHFPAAWRGATDVDSYLLRCSLAGAFGGQPDNLLDGLIKKSADLKSFNLDEMFGVIRSQGRSLELTEDRLWNLGYGSDFIHLLFNLWYREFNYTPAYDNNLPQVDHIFPQSKLKEIKIMNPETGRMVMKYRDAARRRWKQVSVTCLPFFGPADA